MEKYLKNKIKKMVKITLEIKKFLKNTLRILKTK
jgi:hypothetical protein